MGRGESHGSVLEKLKNASLITFVRDDGCEAAEQRVSCPGGEVCSALFGLLGTGLKQDLDRSPRAIPFLLHWVAARGRGSSGPGHLLSTSHAFLIRCKFVGFEV